MTGKWSTDEGNKLNAIGGSDESLKDEFAVVLLQGKNTFCDFIYSYVQITLPNIKRFYTTLTSGQDFTPSDFGTIVAAGTGTPPPEVRKEMATTYKMLEPIKDYKFEPGNSSKPIITEKKSWDDF